MEWGCHPNSLRSRANSGESATAKRARLALTTSSNGEWWGPTATSLLRAACDKWLVHARCKGAWKRTQRWLSEFETFAREMCVDSRRRYDWDACLRSNMLCYLFLVRVANEDRGSTRPVAARRALNRHRKQSALSSLCDDPRISDLIAGVRNARPCLKRQMESLDVNDVAAIFDVWSTSKCWWQRMLAVMVAVGFLTLMRCGEMVQLLRQGVVVVLKSGREVNLRSCKVLPDASQWEGMLLLVVWRKSRQAANAWLPVSCRRTIELMMRHERFLRSVRTTSKYCFPARQKTGKAEFGAPKAHNHMSTSSFVTLMKKALHELCGVEEEELRLYGGHSLRVGGSNFMRWLGVSEDVHKAMGGWAQLISAKEYMQRTPAEQFQMTKALAVKRKREFAVENKADARRLISRFANLSV